MSSSVQIYNLSQNIGEDDLQHLQLFCDYGQLVQKEVNDAPFQKLLFLVRDWSSPYEFSYGEEGGQRFLKEFLKISDEQPPELRNLRKDIYSSFKDIKCFLMPHPGLKVATDREFKGSLSEIEGSFIDHLEKLVSAFLHPRTLQPKTVNGANITCEKLYAYIKVLAEAFKKGNVPGPMSMREATGVANNVSALVDATDKYIKEMNQLCGGASMLDAEKLSSGHQEHRNAALKMFDDVAKVGGKDLEKLYRERLLEMIDKTFQEFERRNDQKSYKGRMIGLFSTIIATVGLAILSAPFSPAFAITTAARFCASLPGFGLTLASRMLGERVGTAIAPCDEGEVVPTGRSDLVHLQEAGRKPPTRDDKCTKK
ncbi:hypothetical protein V5799_033159 [Amblyomma americanum]|uniref:GB1/RHD3-type G domain-containing protein n=1 Tax=Amblyomma americanum TaxID=6943 RepID=A0AAQ4DP42_AMBAM